MLHMLLHLDGGKGGFGSMLRALGKEMRVAKGEDANMDACRDINGRRIRHVNSEKKLTEWYAMEKERKDEEELKRKEHAVATRDVKEQYLQVERDAVIEASKAVTVTIGNAVRQGLKAKKRKNKEMKQGNNDDEAGPSKPQAEQAASAVPGSPSFKKPKTESKKLFNEVGKPAEGPAPAPAAEAAKEFDPIDLQKAKSQKDLEVSEIRSMFLRPPLTPIDYCTSQAYGLDHVKAELMRRGIKCGGTLEQRCERLWAVRGPPELTGEAVPEELKAGGGKPKNHKKEKKRSN